MSGVLKAIGKVFKKVVKVVKKVAIPVLMVGAVVLTGGAALGVLPAMGTMLAGVGITGTMASVLGGAISMGAVGAVTGGLGAAVQGKNIMKGATGGFLVGAATGGIGGGLGLISPNGILSDMGIGSSASAAKGLTASASTSLNSTAAVGQPVVKTGLLAGATPASASTIPAAVPGPAVAPVASAAKAAVGAPTLAAPASVGTQVGSVAAPTAASGGGGLGGLLSAPNIIQLAGSTLAGFAQARAAGNASEDQLLAQQQQHDRTTLNYGYRNIYGTDAKGRTVNGVPISQERAYDYAPQVLARPDEGLLARSFTPQVRVPYYQIVGGQVVQMGG